MYSLLRQIRLFVLGPRSVDSVLKSFNRAANDLTDTAEINRQRAAYLYEKSIRHEVAADRAARVATRINNLTA